MMHPPFSPGPPSGSYEFGEAENHVFRGLAQRMRWTIFAQVTSLVAGVIAVAVTVLRMNATTVQVGALSMQVNGVGAAAAGGLGTLLVSAIFSGFVAYFLGGSAAAFARVANTRGEDVPNLIAALAAQRSYFGVLKWLAILGCVLGVFACVFGMLVAAASLSR